MKHFLLLAFPFLLFSCAGSNPEPEEEPEPNESPAPEVPEVPELPVNDPNDPYKFADPDTTGKLMKEEDKKTVNGPIPVDNPEPAPDSTIEIKPTAPPTE